MDAINFKKNKGFTLLEALVAVSILMVAVSAPITIAQKGLSSAIYSKDQMIASYLAQDAIEYMKNRRDYITMNNPDFDWADLWDQENLGLCLDEGGCSINTVEDVVDSFSSKQFLVKDDSGFYVTSASSSKFSRKINITRPAVDEGDDDEALITVKVSWGGDSNYVEVKTLIYNY